MIPLHWAAAGATGLFPSLDADLEIAPLGPDRTQLAMSARYVPPLGAVGRAIDRAVLFRVAEATLKDFLDHVAEACRRRRARTWPRHGACRSGTTATTPRPRCPTSTHATRMWPMTKKPPLRVMLVDDHEIVRDGIRAMLDDPRTTSS